MNPARSDLLNPKTEKTHYKTSKILRLHGDDDGSFTPLDHR